MNVVVVLAKATALNFALVIRNSECSLVHSFVRIHTRFSANCARLQLEGANWTLFY